MVSVRSLSILSLAVCCAAAHLAQGETRSAHFATSDGVRLHYLDAGKGPAIVFVPGWMVPGWMWQPQIEHFSKKYRVIALDPRSQGESPWASC
jgi:non-heme chloroperoxidase